MKKSLFAMAFAAIAVSASAAVSYSDYEALQFNNVSINGVEGPQSITTSMLYTITYNDDKTLTVEANIPEKVTQIVGFVPEMHFKGMRDGEGDQYVSFANKDGLYTATSTLTFEAGTELTDFYFWFKFAGGDKRFDVTGYKVGSQKEATIGNPIITAQATDITSNSAQINWEIVEGAGMENPVNTIYMDGNVITENPIILSDLTANTNYTHVLKVVSLYEGKEYSSEEVTVTFKTLREGAVALTYNGKVTMKFENCSYNAANPDADRETREFEIPYTIVYNPDETLTISIVKPAEMDGMVGLVVPQVSAAEGLKNFDNFTYTTQKTFEEGTDVNMYFYWPYNGGAARVDFVYKVGSVTGSVTAVESIESNDGVAVYYNLQGQRVANPENGIFVKVVNGKAVKVVR